ncbi:MAG: alpha/beta fold hydrolase [Alphaproteobacteria bacterium]|nr:alpha/beta fold hydrolase [Alphaproteobacteria bacterium]
MSPKKRASLAAVAAIVAASGGLASVFTKDHDQGRAPVESQIAAGALEGTMLSAGKDTPVVLIVPGSGPTDRDGDSPLGIKAAPYRLLAEALANDGVSTVRVDKRGMFASAAAGDPNAVSVDIYAKDYRAWIDAIREQTGAKCVWLLGHSEGGLMVSAAAEGRKDVCGLVLVSAAGRPILDVMRDQLQANPANAPILPEALHAIDELKAGRHVDTAGMNPAIARLFAPQVQDFMISAYGADPVAVLEKAQVRTLILQGSTDLQTSVEDARLLDKAPRTRLVILEGVNHVLKEAPADRAANLATYANPDLPLAPGVAKAIARFVKDDD